MPVQVNINKVDFAKLIQDEMIFYGKRFFGDEDEKASAKRLFMRRYYNALCHMTESQIKSTFQLCAENFEKFPSPSQVLKFGVTRPKVYVTNDLPKKTPVPNCIKREIQRKNTGPSRYRLPEKLMQDMKAMVLHRFGSPASWEDVFDRWDRENNDKPLKT